MARPPEYEEQAVIDALIEAKSDTAVTASILGCARSTVYAYISARPAVREVFMRKLDPVRYSVRNPREIVRVYLATGDVRAVADILVQQAPDGTSTASSSLYIARKRLTALGVDLCGYPSARSYIEEGGQLVLHQLSEQARQRVAERQRAKRIRSTDPDLTVLRAVLNENWS